LVTNLPPESKEKWKIYTQARTDEEKLIALRDFYSSIPKHKGTSNLCANTKRQISILRNRIEEKRKRKTGGRRGGWFIEKQGAAQLVLLGLPNSGKSSLLSGITNANPTISGVPYTTVKPEAGMYSCGDLSFQLIDAPSLQIGAARGVGFGPQVLGLARNADGLIIVLDISSNLVEQFNTICGELDDFGILIETLETQIEFIKRPYDDGVRISGNLVNCTEEDVRRLLDSYRIKSGLIKIRGSANLDQIEDAILRDTVYKPAVIVANKVDVGDAESKLEIFRQRVDHRFEVIPYSYSQGKTVDRLCDSLISILDIIWVYTKNPRNSRRSSVPIIVNKGTTVIQIAEMIHSRLFKNFKFARIWGKSVKHNGQHVGKDHVIADGDTVEIHCR